MNPSLYVVLLFMAKVSIDPKVLEGRDREQGQVHVRRPRQAVTAAARQRLHTRSVPPSKTARDD